jgi:3-methylcrotonyl-CoA carboxylase alpha subunit
MKLRLAGDTHEYEVEVLKADGSTIHARIDGEECEERGGRFITVSGRTARYDTFRMELERDVIFVAVGPASFEFEVIPEQASRRRARGLTAHEVVAPMPGKVLKVLVAAGEVVESGAPLLVLEAMKMETTLYAESPATIAKVHAAPDDMVDHGAVLIDLSPPPASQDS